MQKRIDNVRKIRVSTMECMPGKEGSPLARLIDTTRDEGNYHVFCCVW